MILSHFAVPIAYLVVLIQFGAGRSRNGISNAVPRNSVKLSAAQGLSDEADGREKFDELMLHDGQRLKRLLRQEVFLRKNVARVLTFEAHFLPPLQIRFQVETDNNWCV